MIVANEFWLKKFRIGQVNFQNLVNLSTPSIEKKDTRFRKIITVEKRHAVTLWRFSTRNSYRTVSKAFGIGISNAVN